MRVDDTGLHFAPGHEGSGDVLFDGHHAWSYTAEPGASDAEVVVAWPKRMRTWLDGTSEVVVREGDSVTADALREHAAASLALYKVPTSVHFLASLPHSLSSCPFRLVNPTAIAVSHAISRADTRPPRRSPASLTVDLRQTPNPKGV